MLRFLIVGSGGALGAMLRYGINLILMRYYPSNWPLGTFVINVSGCFLMGLLLTGMMEYHFLPEWCILFLCIGFLGGYTALSGLDYEVLHLLEMGDIGLGLWHCFGTLGLSMAACFAGILAARAIL